MKVEIRFWMETDEDPDEEEPRTYREWEEEIREIIKKASMHIEGHHFVKNVDGEHLTEYEGEWIVKNRLLPPEEFTHDREIHCIPCDRNITASEEDIRFHIRRNHPVAFIHTSRELVKWLKENTEDVDGNL